MGVDADVSTMVVEGSDVYFSGSFTDAGGDFINAGGNAAIDYLARWDGANWNALGSGTGAAVYALAVDGADLYVGGTFSNAGDIHEVSRLIRE